MLNQQRREVRILLLQKLDAAAVDIKQSSPFVFIPGLQCLFHLVAQPAEHHGYRSLPLRNAILLMRAISPKIFYHTVSACTSARAPAAMAVSLRCMAMWAMVPQIADRIAYSARDEEIAPGSAMLSRRAATLTPSP